MNKFPNRLKVLRQEKGLTQEALADRIHSVKSAISNYENGFRTPHGEVLLELAEIFDVDKDYLSGETDFRNNKKFAEEIIDLFVENGVIDKDRPVSPKTKDNLLLIIKNSIELLKILEEGSF